MATTTLLKAWEAVPNAGVKTMLFLLPNTSDALDTFAVTLADYGISATGLLAVESWVQTADGSVITTEQNTTAVSAGVLTVTLHTDIGGTDDDARVIQVIGRADAGVFV